MKKKLVHMLLFIVARIRVIYSPWLHKKFYRAATDESEWVTHRSLGMYQFSNKINQYDYLWDIGKGLLDSSFPSSNPAYFFAKVDKGRDCDDFARIWRLWGEYNGYKGYEYIVTDPAHPFSKAHVVALLEKGGQWWLMNYTPYGPVQSKQQALDTMGTWYDDFVAVQYHFEKEK